jgi:hypothetical protein
MDCAETSANAISQYSTLSTANNSQSDIDFTALNFINASRDSTSQILRLIQNVTRTKFLTAVAKTAYYLNSKAAGAYDAIDFRGDLATTIIEAVSAYL